MQSNDICHYCQHKAADCCDCDREYNNFDGIEIKEREDAKQ